VGQCPIARELPRFLPRSPEIEVCIWSGRCSPVLPGIRKQNGLPAIVVRNTTSKEVRHFGLTNLLGSPRGVAGAEWVGGLARKPVDPSWRPLGANASAEFAEEVLKPYSVGLWAHRLQSNCLHIAFYVTRVDFADGTVWHWDEPGEYETVRARLLGGMERLDLPGKHQGLRRFPCQPRSSRPFGWNLLASAWGPSNASTEVVPFFAFSCPIRDDLTWCQTDEGAMVYLVSSRIRPRLFQRADVCFCGGNPGRIPNNCVIGGGNGN
jgi:hypothetical protein